MGIECTIGKILFTECQINFKDCRNIDGNYVGEFEGFNWYNNGWILDNDNNTCLRISNGAKFKIPLGNTRFNSSTQG